MKKSTEHSVCQIGNRVELVSVYTSHAHHFQFSSPDGRWCSTDPCSGASVSPPEESVLDGGGGRVFKGSLESAPLNLVLSAQLFSFM